MSLSHLSDKQILCTNCMIKHNVYVIGETDNRIYCGCNEYIYELRNRLALMGVKYIHKFRMLYNDKGNVYQEGYDCEKHEILYFDCKSCFRIYMSLLNEIMGYRFYTYKIEDIPEHICNYSDCCLFIDRVIPNGIISKDSMQQYFSNSTKSARNF